MSNLIDLSGKSRSYLTKKLNEMEIPETDSRDYDTEHIKEILIFQAPDMFYDSRDEAKAKTKKPKKVATAKRGGMVKKFSSGGAAIRGLGKVIK
tara:strand:+ start:780 stop:1061 length:282 start_codon:yes stop_codon:yes gene_type:complete